MIHHGDCIEVMAAMEPASVDAIVTDPPYGLEFMGKGWDRLLRTTDRPGVDERFRGRTTVEAYRGGPAAQAWHEAWAREALRVAKPGAYLLSFGGTRTYHRMACAIEDAGWIIRDCLVWAYASGFPKGKANLKPAWEPIVMARKPGPLRELAIDACRIGTAADDAKAMERANSPGSGRMHSGGGLGGSDTFARLRPTGPLDTTLGRWPANVVLTDPIFDGDTPGVVGGGADMSQTATYRNDSQNNGYHGIGVSKAGTTVGYGDSGTYSRFFIVPKSSRSEREPILPSGLPLRENADWPQDMDPGATRGAQPRANNHPTVKPLDLMRHLVRLVTPAGGTVLDPFLGSGTTGIAAELEGFPWLGIEREAEYVAIAEARLNGTQRGLGL